MKTRMNGIINERNYLEAFAGVTVVAFAMTLAMIVGRFLSDEALAVLVGVTFGMGITIFVTRFVVTISRRRDGQREYPPVVVVASQMSSETPPLTDVEAAIAEGYRRGYCVEWYTDEDGHTRVRSTGIEMPAPQTSVPVSRFQVNLGDGFDLSGYPPVPIDIGIGTHQILISVLAANGKTHVAQVEIDHWDRHLSVRAWDQEAMSKQGEQKNRQLPIVSCSCELLNTWEDR